MSDPLTPELLPFRDDALLVRFARVASPQASGAVQSFTAALADVLPKGVVETAPALASVLIRFETDTGVAKAIHTAVQLLLQSRDWAAAPSPKASRTWHIPACFAGEYAPQLAEVADLAGLTPEKAVNEVLETDIRVLAIGFAPGQPYLGLLPERWGFPRQEALTPKVPAGALVAAVRQLVLFANESPTGWRQIGQTAFRPFQPEEEVSFPLRAGDAVRFHAVSPSEFDALRLGGPMGGARVERAS